MRPSGSELPPGALTPDPNAPDTPARLHLFDYSTHRFEERRLDEISTCFPYLATDSVTWLDIANLHDVATLEGLGRVFGLHALTLEDIAYSNQRPKLEEYESYLFIVLHLLRFDPEKEAVVGRQVSLVAGKGYVLTFQETESDDAFDNVRRRLREVHERTPSAGVDYLLYVLIDLVVDHYLGVLEVVGDRIEDLEDAMMATPRPEHLQQINRLRRDVLLLRRASWPLRDVILSLERNQLPFISSDNTLFFRDVYDHIVRTVEMIESSREILASMMELYMSTLSFKTNEVMRLLTVIATFFLPLTFIAGIYGMNFNRSISPLNMPELDWFFGYPFVISIMLTVALGMFLFFRRKGWL